jgi:hypothetical protein
MLRGEWIAWEMLKRRYFCLSGILLLLKRYLFLILHNEQKNEAYIRQTHFLGCKL